MDYLPDYARADVAFVLGLNQIHMTAEKLKALEDLIERHHNAYQETGRELGYEVPASHYEALEELLMEREDILHNERATMQLDYAYVSAQRDGLLAEVAALKVALRNFALQS